ncbi:hypothetical protein Pmar_PMAR018679, partial [Perkinsus marinus ATCC 50983]
MAQFSLHKTPHCLVTLPDHNATSSEKYVALIDTGSYESMISHKLVAELGLPMRYLDVPYTAYIMNGECIMYHATVTLTWRFADSTDIEINSSFLVSPRLPEPFQFVFGSDLQNSKGFYYNPVIQKLVIVGEIPPVQHPDDDGASGSAVELSLTTASDSSFVLQNSDTTGRDNLQASQSEKTNLTEATSPSETTVVMETPHFIITATQDTDDLQTNVFTVDIKAASMPARKARPNKLSHHHPLNKPDATDPTLFDETRARLEGLIQRGCLAPTTDDDDGFMYLTTTYYGVRGSKRARPVFPFRKLNDATVQLLKDCPVRQDPLYSILDATRGYSTLKLMDVSDAFFRIRTGPNLRQIMT